MKKNHFVCRSFARTASAKNPEGKGVTLVSRSDVKNVAAAWIERVRAERKDRKVTESSLGMIRQ